MKLITSVLILGLTGTALAQSPANKPAAAPATKAHAAAANPATKPPQTTSAKPAPTAAKSATPAVKPSVNAKAAATSAKAPAKLAGKKPEVKKAPAVKGAETNATENAGEKKEEPVVAKNRRDPFVSVIVSREGPPCAGGGKKCLAIDQVMLQGVVRSPNGPIAVVSNGTNKTYFLRENDPVYNGVVVKISPDSILFRETVMDRLGKSSQRDVVKKIRPSV